MRGEVFNTPSVPVIRHWLVCGHTVDLAIENLDRYPRGAVWCPNCTPRAYQKSKRCADVRDSLRGI